MPSTDKEDLPSTDVIIVIGISGPSGVFFMNMTSSHSPPFIANSGSQQTVPDFLCTQTRRICLAQTPV